MRTRVIDWRIVGLSLATVGLAILLWHSPLLLPIKLFVVLLHELGHAAAALLTGGSVERLVVTADEGGLAFTRGGNRFLIASAGYLGSLVAGVALMWLARAPDGLRRGALYALALVLLVATLATVRDPFTLLFVTVVCVVVLALARGGGPWLRQGVLWVIGSFSALYAVIDIGSDILRQGPFAGIPFLGGATFRNDAELLAAETFIPAFVWGLFWISLALAFYLWNLFQLVTRR